MKVWVEHWQFACCNGPFKIGDVVHWDVRDPERESLRRLLGDSYGNEIAATEDHHSPDDCVARLNGAIVSIEAISIEFRQVRDRTFEPVAASARGVPVTLAPVAFNRPGRPLGYIVEVN